MAILVEITVNEHGYGKVLGATESIKEYKASRVSFFQWQRFRGLNGVKLVVGDMKLKEAAKKVEDAIRPTVIFQQTLEPYPYQQCD